MDTTSLVITLIVTVYMTILLSFNVSANPAVIGVDGDVKDGGTLILTGTDFGVNESVSEFVGGSSGHIEQTAEGQDSSFGNWRIAEGNGNDAAAFVTSDNARSGDKTWVVDSDYNGSLRYDYGAEIPENTDVFVSWWVRFDIDDGDTGQWKMFRLSHHNDIQDSGTELVMFNWFGGNGDQLIIRPDSCPEGSNAVSYYGGKYPEVENHWVRMDQYIHTSNKGQKDGYNATVRLDDNVERSMWSSSSDPESKYPFVYSYTSDLRYRWFIWQNYRGNGLDSLKVWMDDIYIQVGSFARVELGNAATLQDSNVRDIQRVKSWDNGQIQIEFNPGGFKVGDSAWLYVIDGRGLSSPGFRVEIKGDDGGGVEDGCSG